MIKYISYETEITINNTGDKLVEQLSNNGNKKSAKRFEYLIRNCGFRIVEIHFRLL